MKKQIKLINYVIAASVMAFGIQSCDDDSGSDSEVKLDSEKTSTITQYVDSVVVTTYKSLADKSIVLYEACKKLNEDLSQANIQEACEAWASARKYWEQSEAFLFGAASDYNIDPHIDSWPLDKSQLNLALNNSTLISNMEEYGCDFDGFSTLGYGLLGFHAVEYMIFRDGKARNVEGGTDTDGNSYEALTREELIYCTAVAEDLRNQCIRLEASWAGVEGVTAEKQAILESSDLEPNMNYGESLIAAGETGNVLYKTQIAAYVQILQGASDISDEVGNTKITDPVSSGNVLDVESWYSWNSIDDFADNIRSVQYAYLGSTSGNTSEHSISSYVGSLDESLDNEVQSAINNAIKEIEAISAPFRNHLTESESTKAKSACNTLLVKLEKVIELIQQ